MTASRERLAVSRKIAAENSMFRKIIVCLPLTLFLLTVAQAQQPEKLQKVGWLGSRSASAPTLDLFRRELGTLGYVEDKNIAFEYRYAEGKVNRLPALAHELVRLGLDVLVAPSTAAAMAAKEATKTIPIVFYTGSDPVAAGLVESLARPGRNLTGFTTITAILVGKRLELLKEVVPQLSRVAALWNPQDRTSSQAWKESQVAARELGLQLHSIEVSSPDKFEVAFTAAIKAGSRALALMGSPFAWFHQKRIVDLAAKHLLPAVYPDAEFVASGGLMSYGADQAEPYRRAAAIVDKILKGAKPADLPVERPTKFELVINLKTAKQIDLTIPPNVLARADKVIR
jgi:putative ABC transport system substrate-binding protein